MTYRVKDWTAHYENNRSRDIKKTEWVPVPNRMDGDGYTELMDHPSGAAHLGAWLALVQIASRCDVRGTLVREGGKPHDSASLARISRVAPQVFDEAIPRFVTIGWLEVISVRDFKTMQEGAPMPQEGAPAQGATPQDDASSRARENGMEGMEGKNGKARAPVVTLPSQGERAVSETAERMYAIHPKKKNMVLVLGSLTAAVAMEADPASKIKEIELVHAEWCAEFDWTKQNGNFAPKLDEWIADKGYTQRPDARASPLAEKPYKYIPPPDLLTPARLAELQEKKRRHMEGTDAQA